MQVPVTFKESMIDFGQCHKISGLFLLLVRRTDFSLPRELHNISLAGNEKESY
jgi:hypothetical protein